MIFRNFTLYRLAKGWTRTPGEIETALASFPLHPCTGLAPQSRGWLPVGESGSFAYSQDKQVLVCMGIEEKVLPPAVVRQAVAERVNHWEKERGVKPSRGVKTEIKENVTAELLPRAFSQRRGTLGWFDFEGGWLVVDTASATRADEFTQTLRDALGELPITPLQSEPSMAALMTGWLSTREVPHPFALDDECDLVACDETNASVRYRRHSMDGRGITDHLSDGKRVTRLALTWNERINFVVNDKLQLRRLKWLDINAAREQSGDLTPDQQFENDFALFNGDVAELLNDFAAAVNAAP